MAVAGHVTKRKAGYKICNCSGDIKNFNSRFSFYWCTLYIGTTSYAHGSLIVQLSVTALCTRNDVWISRQHSVNKQVLFWCVKVLKVNVRVIVLLVSGWYYRPTIWNLLVMLLCYCVVVIILRWWISLF